MYTVPRYGVGQLRFSTFFGLSRSPTPRAVGSKERADREQWPYGYLQFPFLARRRWPRFDITNDGVKHIAYGRMKPRAIFRPALRASIPGARACGPVFADDQ